MRIQIPKRPKYVETKTIPFELIAIKGNTRKCADCGGKLKNGSDSLLVHNLDKSICVRLKEKDHFFNKEHVFWKPTYSNHYYHIFPDCLTNRNPSFVPSNLVIRLALDSELKKFLYNRFHWSSCDKRFFIQENIFFTWASIFILLQNIILQIKRRFFLVFLLTFISLFALIAFLVRFNTDNKCHFLAYMLKRVSNLRWYYHLFTIKTKEL